MESIKVTKNICALHVSPTRMTQNGGRDGGRQTSGGQAWEPEVTVLCANIKKNSDAFTILYFSESKRRI